MEQLIALQERLQTPWRSLNERDDLARTLWDCIKSDVGEELSFSDCQRAVGGSIDAVEGIRRSLFPQSRVQVQQDDASVYSVSLYGEFGLYGGLNRCAESECDARLKAIVAALIARDESTP